MLLGMGIAFAPTASSSACLPEGNEKPLPCCQLSIWWPEKREINQVIQSSWWLRNTSCFFIGLDALYWLLFFFLFLLFHFARWRCVVESRWHLTAEHKGTKAVTERCFQADSATKARKERNQIGDLSKFSRSSGESWRAVWKWTKSQRSRAALKLLHTLLLFLFQGLRTPHLHQAVFSLKGN